LGLRGTNDFTMKQVKHKSTVIDNDNSLIVSHGDDNLIGFTGGDSLVDYTNYYDNLVY
jgi:hypothetical protein